MRNKLLLLILPALALLNGCIAIPASTSTASALPNVLAQFVPAGTTASLDVSGICAYGTAQIKATNVTKTDTEVTAQDLEVTISTLAGPVFHFQSKGFVPAAGEKPQLVSIKLKPA